LAAACLIHLEGVVLSLSLSLSLSASADEPVAPPDHVDNGDGTWSTGRASGVDFQAIGANIHANDFPAFHLTSTYICASGSDDLHIQSNAEVSGMSSGKIKLQSDTSGGASGGAYFFCPEGADDVCDTGEVGMVVGVQAGHNPVEQKNVGPKASAFAGVAITWMDNH
jgi:hypothetical protein